VNNGAYWTFHQQTSSWSVKLWTGQLTESEFLKTAFSTIILLQICRQTFRWVDQSVS